jgi:hypothetical protein
MLGAHAREGRVRTALLGAAAAGEGPAREVAPYGFYGVRGDPEAARVFAAGLADRAAPPEVRASDAFVLAGMMGDLAPEERAAAQACARGIAADSAQEKALRVEAMGLLDAASADNRLLRDILAHDPERVVALGAARVLLVGHGADEAEVKAGLVRFASPEKDADLTARSLDAVLRDFGATREDAP